MDFIDPIIEQYALNHSDSESSLLNELNRQTNLNVLQPRMLSGHLQGRLLSSFSKALNPNNILEIGTYTGYSALCLAEGLNPNGQLYTIDINKELEEFAQKYFDSSPFKDNIQFLVGDALELIPNMKQSWDMVFIDADKENYSKYYDLVINDVRKGGWIIADNVLWSGKVTQPTSNNDLETAAIKEFNEKVNLDKRVSNVLVPVRDGMMLIIKN
jgi:predicted O-methyltransferase YrrM